MATLRQDRGSPDRAPMPEGKRERIIDRVLAMRLAPWRPSMQEIANAIADDWPGVQASQIHSLVAGLATRENALRRAVDLRTAQRTGRIESG